MDVAKVQEIAAQFGVPRAYDRLDELLDDPEVEAVYVASPAYRHREQVIAAAERGKHVLCEKPLAPTLADGEAMVAACQRAGVFLQEGYMMRFHGAHVTMRRLIDEGRLGQLVYLRAQLSCWYPPVPGAWRQDPKLGGGGALIDMATHLYDLLEYFAGPVRRVAARTGHLVHGYGVEDAATTLLEFASGAQGTVDCFFCIPDEASRTRLEVYGSQGAVLSEGTVGQSVGGLLEGIFGLGAAAYDATQSKDMAPRFQTLAFPQVNPYTAEFEYFADCILQGRPPETNTGEQGLHILRLVEAAYRSARTGRFVEV